MKVLIMGDRKRYEKYAPQPELSGSFEITYIPRDADPETIRKAGADADILFADAISRVDGDAMRQMKITELIRIPPGSWASTSATIKEPMPEPWRNRPSI